MDDAQKQLIHYVNFNSHLHAPHYNTIEGIMSNSDPKEDLEKTMMLLKKDYVFVDYDINLDPLVFLGNVIQMLTEPKTVFIFTTSLKLNDIVYDQLIHFRESNSFILPKKYADTSINPEAKLFLVLYGDQNMSVLTTKMYELADHVLDIRRKE